MVDMNAAEVERLIRPDTASGSDLIRSGLRMFRRDLEKDLLTSGGEIATVLQETRDLQGCPRGAPPSPQRTVLYAEPDSTRIDSISAGLAQLWFHKAVTSLDQN